MSVTVIYSGPCRTGVIKRKCLNVTLHGGDKVYHLCLQNSAVYVQECVILIQTQSLVIIFQSLVVTVLRILYKSSGEVYKRLNFRIFGGFRNKTHKRVCRKSGDISIIMLYGTQAGIERKFIKESFQSLGFKAVIQCHLTLLLLCKIELEERFKTYVHISVLQKFVVGEVSLCKVRIQSNHLVKPLGRICKHLSGKGIGGFGAVLLHLLTGNLLISAGGVVLPHLTLCVGTVHICLGKIGIKINCLGVIIHCIFIATHLKVNSCTVKVGKYVLRINSDYTVIIIQRVVEITYLRAD